MEDYTTSTGKLKITELDFDAIKTALKSYLEGQDEFKDYDFTGSAMNILLDVLAYNTHYNGFYANMLASEMFMDSASLRSSIVSLAKHLGYTPSSRRGSYSYVDVTFEGATSPMVIPKNAKFTTKIGSASHTFLATIARTANKDPISGKYIARNVEIKEGVYFTQTFTVKGTPNEIFEISNEDVDTTSILVGVAGEVYMKADDITELDSNSKVYFLQEGNQNRYQIYFGDGVIGKKPNVDDQIDLSYNVSLLGSGGNGAKQFYLAESISGDVTSVTIALSAGYTRSSGGADRESTSSIRIQAPRQYTTQKRAVTKNDYRTRIMNDYNLVDSVRVWGGEENIPPEYGSVFICVKPRTGYVLSLAERRKIAQDILKKRNVVSITPRFVEPDYLFVIPMVTFAYDPRKTTRTADQIALMVKSTVINYSATELDKFDEYFRHSVLSRQIDDTEPSITNNNTVVLMKKRIKPLLVSSRSYRIHFDNPLHRPHKGHTNILRSSTFTYRGVKNCSVVDFDGRLMITTSGAVEASVAKAYGPSGISSPPMSHYVINSNVGTVNYETGELIMDNFGPTSITDKSEYISFIAKPRIDDIISRENTIITIDDIDVLVSSIDDTNRLKENKVRGY